MLLIGTLLLSGGAILMAVAFWFRRWWLRFPLVLVATPLVAAGGYLVWFENRWQPAELQETWFDGVTYSRIVRQQPRPIVAHVVRVDLDAAGIDVLVTPPEDEGALPLRAQPTSAFLEKQKLQVAINGGFFGPWHANGPFDFYPHDGDPVTVDGLSISRGKSYTPALGNQSTLFITTKGRAFIGRECSDAAQAISGFEVFIGPRRFAADHVESSKPQPRTAVALSMNERELLLLVVDGRQPNYSEGVTLEEMTELIREQGGRTALHLDGGGSSTLVHESVSGRPIVVNWPIHGRHPPGRERPVANHLGIYANRR